jgi:hypothetical protein
MDLCEANKLLNITKNKVVFVYSAPKVGSTSVVSSLRIFGIDKLDIIHIHDEVMLKVLVKIEGITVNDIIDYNSRIGKEVYIINIYRLPIERKISAFFEKIGSYHFNNSDVEVNKYGLNRVTTRFNDIFPWLDDSDHFIDKYNIEIPEKFDFQNKYLLVSKENKKYITLRLSDSTEWHEILSSIFGFQIRIIKDYESNNKEIKDLYKLFKKEYKIPLNLLNNILTNKYLNYYYPEEEINKYYNDWLLKSCDFVSSFTYEEYKLYEKITIENSYIDFIQLEHYFYDGCKCKGCDLKRNEVANKLLNGENVTEKIIHRKAKTDFINKKIIQPKKKKNRQLFVNFYMNLKK